MIAYSSGLRVSEVVKMKISALFGADVNELNEIHVFLYGYRQLLKRIRFCFLLIYRGEYGIFSAPKNDLFMGRKTKSFYNLTICKIRLKDK